jgi:hypothetical protein
VPSLKLRVHLPGHPSVSKAGQRTCAVS